MQVVVVRGEGGLELGGGRVQPGGRTSPTGLGGERPPMDRHHETRPDDRRRLDGPLGIEVADADRRPPPQIGSNARSISPRSRISSNRSVSPAK
ncbi:MAG: hypothetical protein R2697_12220 [Ilumatobacteraceae bacterium]